MRAGAWYRCPQCGQEAEVGMICNRCGGEMLDEQGNVGPPATFELGESQLAVDVGITLGSYGLTTPWLVYRLVRRAVARRRRVRAVRRQLTAAGAPVSIGAAAAGLVCVRGRVQVLAPPRDRRDDTTLGMFLRTHRYRLGGSWETERGFGLLKLNDGTGVAVIDDDFVQLLHPDGKLPRRFRICAIAVHDGDAVEVVGRAARRPHEAASGAGYRATGMPLVFDGRPDELLLVRKVGSA
jgi:hypothetical protein